MTPDERIDHWDGERSRLGRAVRRPDGNLRGRDGVERA